MEAGGGEVEEEVGTGRGGMNAIGVDAVGSDGEERGTAGGGRSSWWKK